MLATKSITSRGALLPVQSRLTAGRLARQHALWRDLGESRSPDAKIFCEEAPNAPVQPRWAVASAERASCREARTPARSVESARKKRAATAALERNSAGARAASWPIAWYVKLRSADDAASVPASSSAMNQSKLPWRR